MLLSLTQQPIAAAIKADTQLIQTYSSGIVTSDACGTETNQAVLVVGYGIEDGTAYWLVKNSWGTSWGEEGYIRIGAVDSGDGKGICGIQTQPYSVQLSASPSSF